MAFISTNNILIRCVIIPSKNQFLAALIEEREYANKVKSVVSGSYLFMMPPISMSHPVSFGHGWSGGQLPLCPIL